jgi:two-component system sensor histidine kinase DegS
MAEARAEIQTPLQVAEATLAAVQQHTQQLQRQHRELQMLMRQIEAEVQPLNLRKSERTDQVRAIEANPNAYPPSHIKEAYESLSDATMRLYLMQSQLDGLRQRVQWLGGEITHLEEYASILEQLAKSLGESPTAAVSTAGAGAQIDGSAPEGEVARQVVMAQEAHSRQLAHSLQEGPVQVLTNLVLQAEVSQRLLSRNPERAREEMLSLKANLARALGDARFFVSELHPPALEEVGLRSTLRRFAADISTQSGRQVRLSLVGQDVRLGAEAETVLFRVAQEGVRWALACTSAAPVELTLSTDSDRASLQLLAAGPAQGGVQVPADAAYRIQLCAQAIGASVSIAGPDAGGLRVSLEVAPSSPQ